MFFWNSLAFLIIQQMFSVWPLVPLSFINPIWTSGNSLFMYYWGLSWRILSINLQEILKYQQVCLSLWWRSLLFSLILAVPQILFVPSKSLWWAWGWILNMIAPYLFLFVTFLGGSDGKETACNSGDPDSTPGSRSSPGEGNSNPLQHSCLENPMDEGTWWATVHGVADSDMAEWLTLYCLVTASPLSLDEELCVCVCPNILLSILFSRWFWFWCSCRRRWAHILLLHHLGVVD